jgi:hypothetical protein
VEKKKQIDQRFSIRRNTGRGDDIFFSIRVGRNKYIAKKNPYFFVEKK